MGNLEDLYHGYIFVPLSEPADHTDAAFYSDYFDAAALPTGAQAIGFLVVGNMSTASAGNGYTPALYGYAGATPGTATNYTACATTEYTGSFTQFVSTSVKYAQFISLQQFLYRYYHLKLTEEGTAQGILGVYAVVKLLEQPSHSFSATTGAVT